jgi:hypothetical protein
VRTRLYVPGSADAQALDVILNDNRDGSVELGKDRIIIGTHESVIDDVPAAVLVWRPAAFVHELFVPSCLGQRSVALTLVDHAIKLDVGRRHLPVEAVFLVDNSNRAMLSFAHDIGATEQDGRAFLLDLKKRRTKL